MRLFAHICAVAAWLLPAAAIGSPVVAPPSTLSIEHVTVLPMTPGAAPMRDMSVVIEAGRIRSIGRSTEAKAPKAARHVDGRGKWLMPALADMHVHTENARTLSLMGRGVAVPPAAVDDADLFLPYVANGVLQVLNAGATPEALEQKRAVESGRVLGPHLFVSALVDGSPPIWPAGFSHVAATPEQGRQAVRDAKADGYDFVKAYSRLDHPTFAAILDEARRQGVRVIGHIPGRALDRTEDYLVPGFEMVMHAEEFAYQPKDIASAEAKIPQYVGLAKANGTWLADTLTLNERIVEQMRDPATLKTRPEMRFVNPVTRAIWLNNSPYANASPQRIARLDQVVVFNRKLAKAFADADIPVLPSTDTFVPGMVAGFALHDDLEALARAGLSNERILQAATRQASEILGVAADRGTVQAGKRADLLLLDADPLADVANTRRISAVIVGGRYLPRAELDRMMADLAKRYAAAAPVQLPPQTPGAGHFDEADER